MENHQQNPDPLEQWFDYAPKPSQLANGKKWHVFLSYRSVNRAWVLNLYDSLRQIGFEVFLDQFALVPGESLALSLQNALQQSASGIIIWSTESGDSEWCKAEYEAMVTLQKTPRSQFRFVIAKLDPSELPLFARTSLYEDFHDSLEGPRGSGLLRLAYGLIGSPPSEQAVRFAERVSQETKAELAKIEGAKLVGDADRLLELGRSSSLAWLSCPLLPCRVAEALLELGKNEATLDIIKPIEERFPMSIRPRQLRALALARMNDVGAAQQILSVLYAEGHRDPETMGMFARTWMDRYKISQSRRHLETSRDLYAEAFKLFPHDYYTGINAASKSVFLGEMERAEALAKQVEALVGKDVVRDNYWKTATVAEVQLIERNYKEAARLYREAVRMEPEALGNHTSSQNQARMLMDHLGTPADDRAQIDMAFA